MKYNKLLYLSIVFIGILCSCKTPPAAPDNDFDFNPKWNKPSIEINRTLFYAVKNNDSSAVRECLRQNAHPDAGDMLDQSVLMWAVWNGNQTIVRLLLEEKKHHFNNKPKKRIPLIPDINARNKYGYSAVHCSVFKDRDSIYRALRSAYTRNWQSVISATDDAGETILHKAVKAGSVGILNICLDENTGSIINNKNKIGYTPLHLAVILNQTAMVNALLSKHADPSIEFDIQDDDNPNAAISPLFFAYDAKNYLVFCRLLENMPVAVLDNVRVYDNKNNDGLLFAEYLREQLRITEEKPGDVFQKDQAVKEIVRYQESVARRKDGLSPVSEEYVNALRDVFNAVKNGEKLNEIQDKIKSGAIRFWDIDDDLMNDKPMIEYALDNAVDTGETNVLEYLLNNDILGKDKSIIYTCGLAGTPLSPNYIKIMCFLLNNIGRFKISIRGALDNNISKKTSFMYLLDNDDLCDVLFEQGLLLNLLNTNGYNLGNTDSNSNDLRYYVLKSNSNYKNELFDCVFDNVILKNTDIKIDGIKSTALFALENEFYYAAEKLITNNIGFALEEDKNIIANKINQLLGRPETVPEDDRKRLEKCSEYIKNMPKKNMPEDAGDEKKKPVLR